ncbi:Rab-like_protein [Hexamita inflata]|uniref:Rab-like protein n=1 Tax=Hexamita inflata TaxID=28002 RepID=A0AA86RQ67_9EUKA|nr:Rab-like protein [Hexamita inflata]
MQGYATIKRQTKRQIDLEQQMELAKSCIIQLFPLCDKWLSLHELIQSGIYLGEMCNRIQKNSVTVSTKPQAYHYMSNLMQVKTYLMSIGFNENDIFDPNDVVSDNPPIYCMEKVCYVILALERNSNVMKLSASGRESISHSALSQKINNTTLSISENLKSPLDLSVTENSQDHFLHLEPEAKPLPVEDLVCFQKQEILKEEIEEKFQQIPTKNEQISQEPLICELEEIQPVQVEPEKEEIIRLYENQDCEKVEKPAEKVEENEQIKQETKYKSTTSPALKSIENAIQNQNNTQAKEVLSSSIFKEMPQKSLDNKSMEATRQFLQKSIKIIKNNNQNSAPDMTLQEFHDIFVEQASEMLLQLSTMQQKDPTQFKLYATLYDQIMLIEDQEVHIYIEECTKSDINKFLVSQQFQSMISQINKTKSIARYLMKRSLSETQKIDSDYQILMQQFDALKDSLEKIIELVNRKEKEQQQEQQQKIESVASNKSLLYALEAAFSPPIRTGSIQERKTKIVNKQDVQLEISKSLSKSLSIKQNKHEQTQQLDPINQILKEVVEIKEMISAETRGRLALQKRVDKISQVVEDLQRDLRRK